MVSELEEVCLNQARKDHRERQESFIVIQKDNKPRAKRSLPAIFCDNVLSLAFLIGTVSLIIRIHCRDQLAWLSAPRP